MISSTLNDSNIAKDSHQAKAIDVALRDKDDKNEQEMIENGNHNGSDKDTQRLNLSNSMNSKRLYNKKRSLKRFNYMASDTEDGSYVDSMDDDDEVDSSSNYEFDIDECLDKQIIKKRKIESASRRSLSNIDSTCTALSKGSLNSSLSFGEDNTFGYTNVETNYTNDMKKKKKRKIISDVPWSLEEDLVLLEKQRIIGNDWAGIASFLPERSRIDVKVRFISITRAENKLWTSEEDEKLLRLYHEHNGYWVKVSSSFPSRTRNGLKTRFKELRDPQLYPIPIPSYGSPLQVFYHRNHSHFLQKKRELSTNFKVADENIVSNKNISSKSTINRLDVLNACILSKALLDTNEASNQCKEKQQADVPPRNSIEVDKQQELNQHQLNNICYLADAAILRYHNLAPNFSASLIDDLSSKQMASNSYVFQGPSNAPGTMQFSPSMLLPTRSYSFLQPFTSVNHIALNATHYFKVSSGTVKCLPYWTNEGC